jgi:hypothetical protein
MDCESLPWPGFSTTEIQELADYLAGDKPRETARYFLSLTLLPRLLALACPDLPIILFSSTGQRQIIEHLAPYENIVCDFEKPRFFATNNDSVVQDTLHDFKQAIGKAVEIAKARQVLASIKQSTSEFDTAKADSPESDNASDQETKKLYIEVFIDESGDGKEARGMKVGGLALAYPDKETANQLQRDLVNRGLIWGYGEGLTDKTGAATKPKPEDYLPKRLRIDPKVHKTKELKDGAQKEFKKKVSSTFQHIDSLIPKDVRVAAFELDAVRSNAGSQMWGTELPDQLYNTLIRHVLETLMFDWPVVQRNAVEWCIHIATRVDHVQEDKARESQIRWGLNSKQNNHKTNYRVFNLSPDGVVPIIAAVGERRERHLREHYFSGQSPQIDTAKATNLANFSDGLKMGNDRRAVESTRQLHYLADWVVSESYGVPAEWWNEGFQESLDDVFRWQMEAARHCIHEYTRVESFLFWQRAALAQRGRQRQSSHPIERWIRLALAREIANLSGGEICEIARRLPTVDRTIPRLADDVFGLRQSRTVSIDPSDGDPEVNETYKASISPGDGSWVNVDLKTWQGVIASQEFKLPINKCQTTWVEFTGQRNDDGKLIFAISKKLQTLRARSVVDVEVIRFNPNSMIVSIDGIHATIPAKLASQSPTGDLSDLFSRGQSIAVRIESVDYERGTIIANRAALELQDPWRSAVSLLSIESTHTGTVSAVIKKKKVFVELGSDVTGILFAKNVAHLNGMNIHDAFPSGEPIHVKIKDIDYRKKEVHLSASRTH